MSMKKEDFENEDIQLELNQLNETVNERERERKKRVKEEFVVFLFLSSTAKGISLFKRSPCF